MKDIKVNSLGVLDEVKYRKISNDRDLFLSKGEDSLINMNTNLKKVFSKMYPNHLVLKLKKGIIEYDQYYIYSFNSLSNEALPLFRAGQKINITINIDGCYVSKSFTIISSINEAKKGYYSILVDKSDKDNKLIDYLINRIEDNEKVIATIPFGDFTYNKIRDEKNVVGICDSNGIGTFYAMAREVQEKIQDYNLTVFYVCDTYEDFLLYDELLKVDKCSKVKINFLVRKGKGRKFIKGDVTKKLIEQEMKDNRYSIFIDGSYELLEYLDDELCKLDLPKKFIRYNGIDYKSDVKDIREYKLSIVIGNEKLEVKCYNNKTIMDAIYNSGIYIPNKCGNGSCGYCNSLLTYGKVRIVNENRKEVEIKNHVIHPCVTYPLSDVEIIIR